MPLGFSSAAIVIAPAEDQLIEGTETVTLSLSANAAYTLGSSVQATIGILDNDGGQGSVSGTAFLDDNANGLQDAGDTIFAGLLVQLFSSTGVLVATAITNASGNYVFNNVGQGSFYLKFEKPAGYQATLQDEGSNDAIDSDINADAITALFTMLDGQNMDFDAGFRLLPGSGEE
ncbi:MAG: hypothetical protein L0Y72_10730 [Gemmataceae bacterium]|nr:hypothetical protein [Gemmataceae bacterium]MCI0739509.1 hypothetical protein [Gemmataceae bacterium]